MSAPDLVTVLRELLTDMIIAQDNMRDAAKRDPRWEGCAEAIQPRVDAARAALRHFDALLNLKTRMRAAQLTKTPSADHDAGNLRGLAEPNHQHHAVGQGWRTDLENAPRDGTPFLCFHPDDVFSAQTGIDLIWYEPSIKSYTMDGDNEVPFAGITHWMPLPAPPSPAKTGGAE